MKTAAPYGYDEIVPLRKEHRVRLAEGTTPAFARRLNALAVSLNEFPAASRDYPIVFASLDEGASFAPVIVVGLERGVNGFVDASGEWDPGAYFPACVRRYPFCISKLYVDGEMKGERVVCVARSEIQPAGVALFDDQGNPAPAWQAAERLLAEYETDLDRTAHACATLAGMRLFEPFSMQSAHTSLNAMYRVSEPRLRDLKAAKHKLLVDKGFMGAVYAHLHSLQNFSRLAGRQQGGDRG
jgi:hypothetical protein